MDEAIKLSMTIPPIPTIELVAVAGMELMARQLGIDNDKIGEARVLISEAIINAMEYATVDHPAVDVEFTMTSSELIIFIRDYGNGFDPNDIEEPLITKKLHAKRKRGWGLKLMEKLSDGFKVESNAEGTKITMIKKLK